MKLLFSYLPRLAKELSGGNIFRAAHLTVVMWFFVLTRSLLGEAELKLNFFYKDKEFIFFVWSVPDLVALLEVYLWKEYEWDIEKPAVILDLGAHQGDSSVYYALQYPESTIYALEPAPIAYGRLKKNTANFKNIKTLNVGIGDKDGQAKLHFTGSSLGSSLLKRQESSDYTEITLQTLESLISKIGRVDLIKFDIEGSEQFLFISQKPEAYADFYIGEVHSDLIAVTDKEFLDNFDMYISKTKRARNKKRFIMQASLS